MDRFQKEGLANLIGGTIVFLGGSTLAAESVQGIYANFCESTYYSLGLLDIGSVILSAGFATWGAFSPGLIGALSLREHYRKKEFDSSFDASNQSQNTPR